MTRVGVIGLGPMGLQHLRSFGAILGPAALVAAVRHADDRRRLATLPWPVTTVDLAAGARLDAVCDLAVVAVQTERHSAVAAGLDCALLIEKPLCQAPEQSLAVLGRPARTFVAHSSRAEAGAFALHAAVARGDVGLVRAVEVVWREPHLVRPGSGIPQQMGRLYDVGVHAAALVMELVPDLASATVTSTWRGGPAGGATLHSRATWPAGVAFALEVGPAERGGRTVTVTGTDGVLRWHVAPGEVTLHLDRGGSTVALGASGLPRQEALAHAVLAGLATGAPTPFDAAQGMRAMHWAGRWLAAVPAGEVEGAVFEWGWVR